MTFFNYLHLRRECINASDWLLIFGSEAYGANRLNILSDQLKFSSKLFTNNLSNICTCYLLSDKNGKPRCSSPQFRHFVNVNSVSILFTSDESCTRIIICAIPFLITVSTTFSVKHLNIINYSFINTVNYKKEFM